MTRVRSDMTREELASLVCTALERHGIEVVLSGGAVVSIYSEEAYVSHDLDFIRTGLARNESAAMQELGFRKEGRHWKHASTRYWVELPVGPVTVGEQQLTEFATRRTRYGTLRLLSPTDCVKDRLAAYYHWNDEEALEQAVLVAREHRIDLRAIERWSSGEGAAAKFAGIRARLRGAK